MIALLDQDKSGEVGCDVIEGLNLETLKQLADIMDNDPANTESYEYAKYHPKQIRYLVEDILIEAEATNGGQVTSEMFIAGYQSIGGSLKRGNEIFAALNPKNKDAIMKDDVEKYLPIVLEKFEKKMRAEKTAGEAWDQAIKEELVSWNNPRGNLGGTAKSQPTSNRNGIEYRPIEEAPNNHLDEDSNRRKLEKQSEKTFQSNMVHDDL